MTRRVEAVYKISDTVVSAWFRDVRLGAMTMT